MEKNFLWPQVLREKGHRLILDLPVSALGPELEPYMTALMRHILEDPATLQAAMEAEIRSTLASSRNMPSGVPRYAAGEHYRLFADIHLQHWLAIWWSNCNRNIADFGPGLFSH